MGEPQSNAVPPHPRSNNTNCLVYGCLGAIAVLVMVVAVMLMFSFWFMRSIVTEYTDTQGRILPASEMPAGEYQELEQRYNAFIQALDTGQEPRRIELTAEDINALIERHPDWKNLKDIVYAEIHDGKIGGQVSIPLDEFPLGLDGRFLNGSATFDVSLEGGELALFIEGVEVNGKQLPKDLLDQFREVNFARELNNDPEMSQALQKLERIRVEDGKVILVAAEPAQGAPAQETPEEPAQDEALPPDRDTPETEEPAAGTQSPTQPAAELASAP